MPGGMTMTYEAYIMARSIAGVSVGLLIIVLYFLLIHFKEID